MKRAILVVLVLVLSGLLGGAWYFLSSPSPDPFTALGPAPDSGDSNAETALAEVPGSDLAAPEPAPALAVEREALVRTEAQPARGQNIVATGELEIPLDFAGASAPDEALTLYAFFDTAEGGRASRAAEALADSGASRSPDKDAQWAAVPVPVGARSVRVPTPDGMQSVSYLARGRFYTSGVEATGADNAPDPLSLELGSWLTGSVVLPDGWEARGVELDDVEVDLDTDSRGGLFAFSSRRSGRAAEVGEDLSYEFHAVVGRTAALAAEVDGLVDFNQRGIALVPGERVEFDLALELGGAVHGRVTDEAGAPVADAAVRSGGRVWFMPGDAEFTDEDGNYTLYGVTPGKVKLAVSATGFTDGEVEAFELADGEERAGVDVVLRRGAAVAGRVLWPDGRAARGAMVEVFQEDASNPFGSMTGGDNSVRTDAEGRFRLTGLSAEGCRLTATAVVGEEGEPIAIPAASSVKEDPDELMSFPVGPSVELPDGAKWKARAEAVGGQTAAVVLTLQPPGSITGRVLDDTGEPIRQFTVSASPVREGRRWWGGQDSLADHRDSEDGRFEIEDVPIGRWELQVSAGGYGDTDEEWRVEVPQLEPIEIVLTRGAALAGVVLDPAGNPVVGATVSAREGARSWSTNQAQTWEGGEFSISGLAPQSWTLSATHPDWAASEDLSVEPGPAMRLRDLVLTLRVGGTITGEVFTDEGEPRVGARVSWGTGAQQSFDMDGEGPTTDEDGRFVLENVTPGKVTVTAMPSQDEVVAGMEDAQDEMSFINVMGAMRTKSVEVVAGAEVHVVLGGTPKQPVTVHGTVREAGATVAGARVMVVAEGGSFIQGMKATTVDGEGRFEVVLDRPGAHVFHVGTEAFGNDGMGIQFYEDVPQASTHTVRFDLPTGRIEGRVLGLDGAPMEGVAVRLSNEGGVIGIEDIGESDAESTDAEGEFAFEHLWPGTYALRAGGARSRFRGALEDVGVQTLGGLALGENEVVDDIVIRMGAAGVLKGTVRDSAGAPVKEASVFARDAAGHVLAKVSYVTTDAAGRFTYEGLPAGELTVTARNSELTSAEETGVRIEAGATTEVELTLDAGSFVVVAAQVDGEPVRARLKMIDEQGHELQGLFAAADMEALFTEGFSSKERRIGPVPPGEYEIFATAPDGKEASRKFTVRPGQEERKVKLRLK